jgi:hypothetical protein
MAQFKNYDAARNVCSTSSTGALTLGDNVTGCQSIKAKMSSGDTAKFYFRKGSQWISFLGTFAAPDQLARTRVIDGSGGLATNVDFNAGAGEVGLDVSAEDLDLLNTIETSLTSAATFDIGTVYALRIRASGATGPVTSLGSVANKFRIVRWAGATLTCNTTSMILIGLANAATRVTVDGDIGFYASDASGNWRELYYQRASGAALVGVSSLNGQSGAVVSYFAPQGRLTLQSGVPVMITTQSAKTTLYYALYNGNLVPLFDGTNMVPTTFSELSVATTDTTKNPAAIGASKVNDWFVWSDAGTLRLSHGPDWTNDTTRSAGTALVMATGTGILVNNASITNGPAASRGTYVGTTRSNASSQLDWIFGASAAGGTAAWFGVWNMYNRVNVNTTVTDSTISWLTATSATFASLNGSATNRISAVAGLAEDGIRVSFFARMAGAAVAFANVNSGFALDATNVADKELRTQSTASGLQIVISASAEKMYDPQLGFHFWQAVQAGDGTNAGTIVGGGSGGFSGAFRM